MEDLTPAELAKYVAERKAEADRIAKRENTNYFDLILDICAEDGFVVVKMRNGRHKQLTVDAALERADGIRNLGLTGDVGTLFHKLYESAGVARSQWQDLLQGLSPEARLGVPEFMLKEEQLRRLELYKHKQLDDLVGVEKVTV